jgi:hypothetical protein
MRRLALGLAAALLLAGCAGLKAREHVLLPAMKMAWAGITNDVDAGLTELTVDEAARVRAEQSRMTLFLDASDVDGILMVDWRLLRETAEKGILKRLRLGEVGPGVAKSLHERLVMFTRALLKLEQGS